MTNKSVYQSFLWEIIGQVQQVLQIISRNFISKQKLFAVMLGMSEQCPNQVCKHDYKQKHGLGQEVRKCEERFNHH